MRIDGKRGGVGRPAQEWVVNWSTRALEYVVCDVLLLTERFQNSRLI